MLDSDVALCTKSMNLIGWEVINMNEALKSKRYSVLCDLISEIKPEKGKCKWERSNVTGKTVEYYYTKYCDFANF